MMLFPSHSKYSVKVNPGLTPLQWPGPDLVTPLATWGMCGFKPAVSGAGELHLALPGGSRTT